MPNRDRKICPVRVIPISSTSGNLNAPPAAVTIYQVLTKLRDVQFLFRLLSYTNIY